MSDEQIEKRVRSGLLYYFRRDHIDYGYPNAALLRQLDAIRKERDELFQQTVVDRDIKHQLRHSYSEAAKRAETVEQERDALRDELKLTRKERADFREELRIVKNLRSGAEKEATALRIELRNLKKDHVELQAEYEDAIETEHAAIERQEELRKERDEAQALATTRQNERVSEHG